MSFVPDLRALLAGALIGASLACTDAGNTAAGGEQPTDSASLGRFRYNREYIYLSHRGEPPLVAPFTFRAIDDGTRLRRSSLAWLARGSTWDRFHEEAGETSRAGGVWRVVPQGDLRLVAGGPAEIEAIRFVRAERRLRLDFEPPISDWFQAGEVRFRLLSGTLAVGSESLPGSIVEVLRVERLAEDGWPPSEDYDTAYLTSGDSLQLVIFAGGSSEPMRSWMRLGPLERSLAGGEVRWLEMRPLQEARRDVPVRWTLEVSDAGLVGELEAVGYDILLGPERAGRRAVEIRYSVTGWIELQEGRWEVFGMIRHGQQ